MKKVRWSGFILLFLCLILSACAAKTRKFINSKNTEFVAMLSDPAIRKDFHRLKAIAINATVYRQNNKAYFSSEDIKKLNDVSVLMINRLQYEYHLTASRYKIHTFIGKNEYNSCYQYYNSYDFNAMNKSCHEFSEGFASCALCNNFIKGLRFRKFSVMHSMWWHHEKTIDLVETFKLRNGDTVYMGLEISVD